MFQFQTGSIKRILTVLKSEKNVDCFNSKLVRLKGTRH